MLIRFTQEESEPGFRCSVTCPRRVTIKFRTFVFFEPITPSNPSAGSASADGVTEARQCHIGSDIVWSVQGATRGT